MHGQSLQKQSAPKPSRRAGFSLVELLVVMLVIAALLAFLLPALAGVQRNVRNAQVKAEIAQLENALASFKSIYNVDPPSRLILTEDPSTTAWESTSRSLLRKIWPKMDFTQTHDFDHDGNTDKTFALTGAECLVFFLGGIQDRSSGSLVLTGFSKNPVNPFDRSGENRDGPFFTFDYQRFVDVDGPTATGDFMPEYVDALPGQVTPYLYLSSLRWKRIRKARCRGFASDYGSQWIDRKSTSRCKHHSIGRYRN